MIAILIGSYLIGFVLTILFFVKFGKRIGFDYDVPKTYANFDDWSSNTEAYSFFSFTWPITMPFMGCYGLWSLAKFVGTYLMSKFSGPVSA